MSSRELKRVRVVIPAGEATCTFVIEQPQYGRVRIETDDDGATYVRSTDSEDYKVDEVRLPPEQVYSLTREYE